MVLIDSGLLCEFYLTLLTLSPFTTGKWWCAFSWLLAIMLRVLSIFLLVYVVFRACSFLLSFVKFLTKLRSGVNRLYKLNWINQILSTYYPWVDSAHVIVDLNIECWFRYLDTALTVWNVAQLGRSQVESVALHRPNTWRCSCLFLFDHRTIELLLLFLILSFFRVRALCFYECLFLRISM